VGVSNVSQARLQLPALRPDDPRAEPGAVPRTASLWRLAQGVRTDRAAAVVASPLLAVSARAGCAEAFVSDTPIAVLIRQILGAVSQFEKATLVAKLEAARGRKRRQIGKCEGRKGYAETHAALVAEVRDVRHQGQTLEQLASALAERGHVHGKGNAPAQIFRMCARTREAAR
jgi:hypothetical protein